MHKRHPSPTDIGIAVRDDAWGFVCPVLKRPGPAPDHEIWLGEVQIGAERMIDLLSRTLSRNDRQPDEAETRSRLRRVGHKGTHSGSMHSSTVARPRRDGAEPSRTRRLQPERQDRVLGGHGLTYNPAADSSADLDIRERD